MQNTFKAIFFIFLAALLAGCDDNDKAVYGKESGLPVNCRAYVQVVIDEFKAENLTAEEAMNGLERNCGINGHAWKNNR